MGQPSRLPDGPAVLKPQASSLKPCGAEGVDTAGQRLNVNAVGSRREPACVNAPMGRGSRSTQKCFDAKALPEWLLR